MWEQLWFCLPETANVTSPVEEKKGERRCWIWAEASCQTQHRRSHRPWQAAVTDEWKSECFCLHGNDHSWLFLDDLCSSRVYYSPLPDRTTGPGCRRNLDVVCLRRRTKTGSGERKTIDLRDHYFIVLHMIMCMCFSFQKSLIVSAFFSCVTSMKCVGGSGDGEIQMG